MSQLWKDEKGATMVFVALVMLVLIGAAALAIDAGVLYTARTQCQNAADSGALACGGHMLMFNTLNAGVAAKATAKGVEYANYNQVLSTPVAINNGDVTVDLNLKRCRVCVPRTAARGNPVPTFFARIWRNSVDVSACATAEVVLGNSISCMKPWALPDAFADTNGNGKYDAGEYYEKGVTSYATDYRNNGFDIGVQLIVKQANPGSAIAPGQFFPIDLPIPGSPDVGGDRYRENISGCNPSTISIGDTLWTQNGNLVGPTKQGVEDLIAQDSGAKWDAANKVITGSKYGETGSPRIIRIPFFDPRFPFTSGKQSFVVTNIASLFLEDISGNGTVTARILPTSGIGQGASPGGLQTVRLVE
ncbi:MAG TPA: pilus assembly protein TadG-related protein [Candidatus Polarisedimenticolia bacterium]|nr:pilus assembly protein TadG-related protein [Candidatus Polarisedimenticolia bacterium]